MAHPMSEFSHRSHDIFRQGIPHTPGPFSPEELPSIQYEMHGETTVDQRATEMLRKPTEAEVKQLGDPFRSDLNPHNYRTHTAFIPDSNVAGTLDIQTDFQVWAVVIATSLDSGMNSPVNSLQIANYNLAVASNGIQWVNFPTGQSLSFRRIITGAPTSGTGWFIWCYDRWIPEPGGAVAFF